jgi:phage-related minor tail protein
LKQKIRQRAAADESSGQRDQVLQRKKAELQATEDDAEQARQNLARARTDAQYEAVAATFEELTGRKESLRAEILDLEGRCVNRDNEDAEVEKALELVERLTELVGRLNDYETVRELVDAANGRLFLRFEQHQPKKRILNKLVSGVVTVGAAPPPIAIYEGATGRGKLNNKTRLTANGKALKDLTSRHETRLYVQWRGQVVRKC